MTGGSAEPEHPTDGECSSCGRYFRDVGNPSPLEIHELKCDGDGETGGDTGGEPEFPENPDADEEDEEEIACPDCGGDLVEYDDHPGMYHCPECNEWWEPEG